MNLNYKTWSPRTRVIWIFVIAIASFIFFCNRAHADETVAEHLQDALFEGIASTVALVGAAQQAATGNFVNGAMLAILCGREAMEAFGDVRAAWDIYFDPSYNNDRDISPSESQMDHGRD